MSDAADSFKAFLQEREGASLSYVQGDPGAFMRLVASQGDATFFPPKGGWTRGAQEVADRYEHDAHAFLPDTRRSSFEIFHMEASDTVAYWTGLQHAQVRMQGMDGLLDMTLRVTEVFRREAGQWKIVHRHADMLTDEQHR